MADIVHKDNIENIRTSDVQWQFHDETESGVESGDVSKMSHTLSPGIIDIFLNNNNQGSYLSMLVSNTAAFYGDAVKQQLLSHDIMLASKHGIAGISVEQLLLQPDDCDVVYYEIGITDYIRLPRMQKRLLLKRFCLILHDFTEVGFRIRSHDIRESLESSSNTRDLIIASSSYENYDHLGNNVRTITIPMFAHMTVSKFAENNRMHSVRMAVPNWDSMPEQLAMILIRKPKPERIAVLSRLHDLDQLDKCTWSFVVNLDKDRDDLTYITPLRWEPSIQSDRFARFITKYKHSFPVMLPGEAVKNYSAVTVDPVWFNSHRWYVSCETDQNIHFVTEKTFKGMLLGMTVLPVAKAGTSQLLCDLGFCVPTEFDHLSGEPRAEAIVDYMLNTEPDLSQARHNFELLNNKQFMTRLATQPLIDLFYPS